MVGSGANYTKRVTGMFIGEYQHTLDNKGRVIMPSKFREGLGSDFIMTKGLDNCLFVYSREEWSVLEQKLRALPLPIEMPEPL